MKKFLIALVLILALMFTLNTASAVNLNSVENIDSIHVNIPATIKVIEGDNFYMQVYTSDTIMHKQIKKEVINGVLFIKPKNYFNYDDMKNFSPNDVRIRIITPNRIGIGTRNGFTITYSDKKDESGKSTI
jgi:hypothetical protein